uniref:Glyco_hydro_19_cat domain-containing protein n=1 Tax=Heterorhabditis bacteriophora TaxID=37862 RepID=A0A1I7XL83_HETBA
MDPPLAMMASLWFYMTPQPPKPAMHDIVMGPGESRRIKAFKWFCTYFNVPIGDEKYLSCKDMPIKLESIRYNYSYQPDWGNTWKEQPCDCAPAPYGGLIPYFDPAYYPEEFVSLNEANRLKCVASIYANPTMYSMKNTSSACLNH